MTLTHGTRAPLAPSRGRDQESLWPDRNGRCPGVSRRHRGRLAGQKLKRRGSRRRCGMQGRAGLSARGSRGARCRRLPGSPRVPASACSSQSSASLGFPRCGGDLTDQWSEDGGQVKPAELIRDVGAASSAANRVVRYLRAVRPWIERVSEVDVVEVSGRFECLSSAGT